MIKIILIVIYAVVFGASAVIFLLYGKKKGLWGGVTVIISAAAAFIASYFLAPVTVSELFRLRPVQQFIRNIVDTASQYELDSVPFVNILSDTVQRVLEIPAAIMLYLLFFIVIFVLTRTVMRFIKPINGEKGKNSVIIGAVLGAAAPIAVAVLTLFVSKINLFDEAASMDVILPLASKSKSEIIWQICDDPDLYTKILFETTLTSADEKQRLELVNKCVNALASNGKDRLLSECFDFEGYSSRSGFEDDIRTAAEMYKTFEGIDIFEEDDLTYKLLSIGDKEQISEKMYQLSFKNSLIRYIISYSVRRLTGSDDFICPDGTVAEGDYEDFAALLITMEKFENNEISQIDLLSEIKDSPLLPTEMYAELIF